MRLTRGAILWPAPTLSPPLASAHIYDCGHTRADTQSPVAAVAHHGPGHAHHDTHRDVARSLAFGGSRHLPREAPLRSRHPCMARASRFPLGCDQSRADTRSDPVATPLAATIVRQTPTRHLSRHPSPSASDQGPSPVAQNPGVARFPFCQGQRAAAAHTRLALAPVPLAFPFAGARTPTSPRALLPRLPFRQRAVAPPTPILFVRAGFPLCSRSRGRADVCPSPTPGPPGHVPPFSDKESRGHRNLPPV
jgi:hypothetical protein